MDAEKKGIYIQILITAPFVSTFLFQINLVRKYIAAVNSKPDKELP